MCIRDRYELRPKRLISVLPWQISDIIEITSPLQYTVIAYNYDAVIRAAKIFNDKEGLTESLMTLMESHPCLLYTSNTAPTVSLPEIFWQSLRWSPHCPHKIDPDRKLLSALPSPEIGQDKVYSVHRFHGIVQLFPALPYPPKYLLPDQTAKYTEWKTPERLRQAIRKPASPYDQS